MSTNSEIRQEIEQNDVSVMRSYLEVDVAEWFSDNEIPFGYEAFVIPSVVTAESIDWQRMVNAIQALGREDRETYKDNVRGTPMEDRDPFSALSLWGNLHDKHQLGEEQVSVPVIRSLTNFSKSMILPDFALYPDANMKTANEEFNWSDYSYLIEVAGLYGVGLPDESAESDWWDWYRVSAVAFKEFMYKLLDLWDDVYWVVPNSQEISPEVRDDDHYVVINPIAEDLGLDPLADELGITQSRISGGLSNLIELYEYQRPDTQDLPDEFDVVEWEYDSIDTEETSGVDNVVAINDEYVVFHGDIGEVYLSDSGVQVRQSMWREMNLLLLREYVTDVVSGLADEGVVIGLHRVA